MILSFARTFALVTFKSQACDMSTCIVLIPEKLVLRGETFDEVDIYKGCGHQCEQTFKLVL